MDRKHGKKEVLALIRGSNNFVEIRDNIVQSIIAQIEKYQLSVPKMSTRLMQEIALEVERHLETESKNYVTKRLNEQVDRYIELGMAEYAGYSFFEFREALKPLMERVMRFFAPPTEHPISRGEFTLLLVLPPHWIPLRRQLLTLAGDYVASPERDVLRMGKHLGIDNLPFSLEERKNGKVPPREPYVIVGIDGGRTLRDSSIAHADVDVEKSGYTYLSIHELIQLLLVRPRFLIAPSSTLSEQIEMFALGEKCASRGIVKLVAKKDQLIIEYVDEGNLQAGVGVGKPYYQKIIT